MKACYLLLGILFATLINWTNQANILYVSVTPSPSHAIWDAIIAKALLQKGHKVTFVATAKVEKSTENFTFVHLDGPLEYIRENYKNQLRHAGPLSTAELYGAIMTKSCEMSLQTEGMKFLLQQIKNNVTYDLYMQDISSGICMYPIIRMFGSPPVIATSPFGVPDYLYRAFGMDVNPAYTPMKLTQRSDKMTFFERITNVVEFMIINVFYEFSYIAGNYKIAVKFFGDDIEDFNSVQRNFSLLLASYSPIWDYPTRLPPAVIPIGWLTLAKKENISKDLKHILDNAKHGVIYFSLGTNIIIGHALQASYFEGIMEVFKELKQTILWKCPVKLQNVPQNVVLRDWFPQNEILAHPNVVLFITHAGGLSLQEAAYYKVPVIGIPWAGDHKYFLHKIVTRKFGVQLDFSQLTKQSLSSSIQEVLTNPEYKKNLEILSKRLYETPEQTLERAVWWVEYILRNGGGHHLRLASVDMNLVQTYSIDVIAFIFIIIWIIYILLKKLFTYKTWRKVKTQ